VRRRGDELILSETAFAALVEHAEFLPATTVEGKLLTLRRARSHLFARYQLPRPETPYDS
jgi:hypothetical protein